MRRLILTTAAVLAIAGATSSASFAKQHHHAVSVTADSGAAPADTMDPHAARAKNLRDAGYNPKKDFDAAGNVRQN